MNYPQTNKKNGIKNRLEHLNSEKTKLLKKKLLTKKEIQELRRINDKIDRIVKNPELIVEYPVKDFLLSRSYLVKLNEKEASGREWNTKELAQEDRIFNKRDKAMDEIKQTISKYYSTVINGDYRIDGMPEIRRGIRGWIEEKIWKILIGIGEPNHPRLKDEPAEYWAEAK